MAIDITRNTTHNVAFPSKMLASYGGAHQYNITLTANHDNGTLVARGTWNSFDNYNEGTVAASGGNNDFAGVIRAQNIDDATLWYVEITANSAELLFVYNSPESEYDQRDFQSLPLFYNAAGDVVRAFEMRKGDIVLLSTSAFNGTPVAGKSLTYANGKYVVGA